MARRDADSLAGELLTGLEALDESRSRVGPTLEIAETGTVESVGNGVALVSGLPGVAADEIVRFESGTRGVATDLGEELVGVTLLEGSGDVRAGSGVTRTGKVLVVKGDTHKEKSLTTEYTEREDGSVTETRILTDRFVPVIRAWDLTPGSPTRGEVLTIR